MKAGSIILLPRSRRSYSSFQIVVTPLQNERDPAQAQSARRTDIQKALVVYSAKYDSLARDMKVVAGQHITGYSLKICIACSVKIYEFKRTKQSRQTYLIRQGLPAQKLSQVPAPLVPTAL